MIDIEDPRAAKIAEAISNNTAKKILNSLSENEMSEGEIAEKMKLPMNTVGYNIKKLMDAGLIERSKKFLWSAKGKRVNYYRVAERKIIISPKTRVKTLLPVFLIMIVLAVGVRFYFDIAQTYEQQGYSDGAMKVAMQESMQQISEGDSNDGGDGSEAATWFLIGGMSALVVFILWNWRKE